MRNRLVVGALVAALVGGVTAANASTDLSASLAPKPRLDLPASICTFYEVRIGSRQVCAEVPSSTSTSVAPTSTAQPATTTTLAPSTTSSPSLPTTTSSPPVTTSPGSASSSPTTTAPASTSTSATPTTSSTPSPSTSTTPTTAPPSAQGLIPGFTGSPTAPEPFTDPNWYTVVHSRDREYWAFLQPMEMEHTAACGSPGADGSMTHHSDGNYADAIFRCKDHVMTGIHSGGGYALITMTPNKMVDFTTGTGTVGINVSTHRKSARDWIEFCISAPNDALIAPLRLDLPDLGGPPKNGVCFEMNGNSYSFNAYLYRNGVQTALPQALTAGYDSWLTPDSIVRSRFEIQISGTHLKFGMPDYGKWWIDTDIAQLGWTKGVVQFIHHSYNPEKVDCPRDLFQCIAGTWHWVNPTVWPQANLTFVKPDKAEIHFMRSEVPDSANAIVTFPQPSQAGDVLKFMSYIAAYPNPVFQVRFNGGAWVNATRAPVTDEDAFQGDAQYSMVLPAGTTSVEFRPTATPQSGFGWVIRDIAIWRQ